jgi:hypothetical protein
MCAKTNDDAVVGPEAVMNTVLPLAVVPPLPQPAVKSANKVRRNPNQSLFISNLLRNLPPARPEIILFMVVNRQYIHFLILFGAVETIILK